MKMMLFLERLLYMQPRECENIVSLEPIRAEDHDYKKVSYDWHLVKILNNSYRKKNSHVLLKYAGS